VRLITRGGYDWARRYPWIVEAAQKIRQRRFVLDGEAVVLGVYGISDFNALPPAGTTTKSSSVRSIFWSRATTTCESCGRRTWGAPAGAQAGGHLHQSIRAR
jgi:hypothetical protein